MPTSTVNWLWFGNEPQINSTPTSPATRQEANAMVGYTAEGRDEIEAVEVTGDTHRASNGSQAFTTTFSTKFMGGSVKDSQMTYHSPHSGTQETSEITGFLSVRYRITLPDNSSVDQDGVLIQMANGDMFFRPVSDTVDDWAGITSIRSVEILTARPYQAGNWVAPVTFSPDIYDMPIVCFAAGTMILTDRGERAVEELAPGDMVWTRDNGFQPLRWRGARKISAVELNNSPQFRPVRISAGALGAGLPAQNLVVSPQHRVLVRSNIAQRMFGAAELLVAARQLTSLPGIELPADIAEVTYVHLMFDRHEVVLSNGAETESLYPGPQALLALGKAARDEILALFPELHEPGSVFPGARPFAAGKRARKLAERHYSNSRPLVSASA